MRLRFGRPDLAQYADRFDVPAADSDLSVTFLGVATLLVSDGETSLMTDGFFSRPSLPRVALRALNPDDSRIDTALNRVGVDRLAAVLPVHSHFDHAMDSAVVAERTGAQLVGGTSTANIGRGHGLPESRIDEVAPGDSLTFGDFTLTLVESHHCPPDRYPGTIDTPVGTPARASAYKCGEAWSTFIRHASGRSVLVQGSAGFVPGALAEQSADVVYLGVGQLGVQSEEYMTTFWQETVRAVGARRVVLIHWDDFFRPLDEPMRALPYAGDDLDETMRVLDPLARADGVDLHFPTVWRREDPWA
ncbi:MULTISPECIES: MBL fold metallo-hydrolase [unclassified Nocardioides]|uniref:MBL fold metallo-hydrolase n=1 Tax=unclassified Nocardioides TaxID=2615069 RepID=UPI0006F64D80|nr:MULTISPECIES: MBL fold metallo-hydrolase [unclassified Nocardioides]KQY57501.1 MBL fold metallo-hydrolase [Nocardioides sp. Root140]KRF20301.1 MBL fold metallo-hydrolase [Nocardioides sp. Soil796]